MNKPIIVVTQHWIDEYVSEVMNHPGEETGRGIDGIVMNDKTVYVLGILIPTDSDISRSHSQVRIGGPDMGAAVEWLERNWNVIQKKSQIAGQFAFLSSAHSHYTLGLRTFSSRDKQTMLEYVRDEHLPLVVGVLANIETNKHSVIPIVRFQPGVVVINHQWNVRLTFYYLDAEMVKSGAKEPIPVTPKIVEAKDAPQIPPLGWQFANKARFDKEIRLLTDMGCTVGINYREMKANEPLYIQLVIGHPSWRGILNILTPWDYPVHEPSIQVLPLADHKYVPSEFGTNEKLKTGPLWQPGDNFIQIIFRLRARGDL